ncbi:hypothetical protein HY380_02320 [Candidatus Saccharibacteria bacterium]|nr:hypothetical protein [Candidatus Saccharibacteria bacterium]
MALATLLVTTNPVDKLSYTMVFFLLLLVMLVSSGYTLVRHFRGQVSPQSRYRLFITSLFLVVLLMFRSSQSLGWLEGLVLLAVSLGLLFYGGRRA